MLRPRGPFFRWRRPLRVPFRRPLGGCLLGPIVRVVLLVILLAVVVVVVLLLRR